MKINAIKLIVSFNVHQESAKVMCKLEASSLHDHVVATPASAQVAVVIFTACPILATPASAHAALVMD